MRRSRQARRVKNKFPPGLRLILLVLLLIGAAFGLWRGEENSASTNKPADSSGSREAPNDLTGIASVMDGDTLDLHGKRIRLYGIDAPESLQSCSRDGRRHVHAATVSNSVIFSSAASTVLPAMMAGQMSSGRKRCLL